MQKAFYLVLYGFLGWALERVINVVYFGFWYDNRVLFTYVQPMYGLGVVLTLIAYERFKKKSSKTGVVISLTIIFAIIFTAFSEFISGLGYEYLYGELLWDYRMAFPSCYHPYVCIIPSSLFGVLSAFTVIFVHPHIEVFTSFVPKYIKAGLVGIVVIDFIWTYLGVVL